MSALDDLSRIERAIETLVKRHGAAKVRRHFARLEITNWPAWQRVHSLISRKAKR